MAKQPLSSPAVVALLALIAVSLGLRWFIAATTVGTNDIIYWNDYGTAILDHGLINTYRTVAAFNQPPLPGLWAAGAVWFSRHAGISFRVIFKTLPILADVLGALLLISLCLERERARGETEAKAWRAALAVAVLFLWNPLSVLVSSYHGNTDSLVGVLCLLAALLVARNKPFAGGIALAGSLNVKLVGVFLLPSLMLWQKNARARWDFVLGMALGLVPFVPVLALAWHPFYDHVLAYNSKPEKWGIEAYLQELSNLAVVGELARKLRTLYEPVGRYIMGVLSTLLGLWCVGGRRGQPLAVAATALSLFLVLTPGFGIQYLVWPCALLFAVDVSVALGWSLAGGAMALTLYLQYWNHRWQGALSFFDTPYGPAAELMGLTAWLLLTKFVIDQIGLLGSFRPNSSERRA